MAQISHLVRLLAVSMPAFCSTCIDWHHSRQLSVCKSTIRAGAAQSHHSVPVLSAALSPAAVAFTQAKSTTPTVPGRSSRGKIMCTPVAILQTPSGPGASAAGSKRKAEELQQDGRLEVGLRVLHCIIQSCRSHQYSMKPAQAKVVHMRRAGHCQHLYRLLMHTLPACMSCKVVTVVVLEL